MRENTMELPAFIRQYPRLWIALIGCLAYLPFLGAAPLFDWDEINFAESAREMLVSGNYFQVQINFQPFWEKPPLFIWMQVLCMKAFGVNEFAARLPNALVGIATLLTLFEIGNRLKSTRFAWSLVILYFISFLPHLYFKSGIIDPTFNLFIFLGLYQILLFELGLREEGRSGFRHVVFAGLFIGLATLTKGPVAMLITTLSYFIFKVIWDRKLPWAAIGAFAGIYLLVILSWFGTLAAFTEEGMETVRKFIVYQVELFMQPVAGHEQPPFYHFAVFILGCFPLSAFTFRAMFGAKTEDEREQYVKRLMTVMFWVVMILFTIVKTKIIHYSSLLYFPGAMLSAYFLEGVFEGKYKIKWDSYLIYVLGFILFGVGSMLIGVLAANIEWVEPMAKGKFAQAALQVDVAWNGFEFIPGLVFFLATGAGLYFLVKQQIARFFLAFVVAMPIYANGIDALILPRIADYTQNSAIRFLKKVAKEDAYVMVEGFKSYAHYFYGEVKPFPHPEMPIEARGDWMARGEVDKPVYLLARVDKVSEEFEKVWFEKFHRIDAQGGYIFFLRNPSILTNPQ